MRSIEFAYTYYKGLYIPVVPLQLNHRSEWFEHWAFVDSGATYSVFHAREASNMELDLDSSMQRMIVVGDGSFIPAAFVKMPTRIGDVELEIEIGFSERLGVGFNLLGRKDLFEKFQVCFSDSKRTISFHFDESITQ